MNTTTPGGPPSGSLTATPTSSCSRGLDSSEITQSPLLSSINLDKEDFRAACSKFPTGITITTVKGADGRPYGITVNSFTSVSWEPPLVLVCIDYRSQILGHLVIHRYFGINCLSHDQQELSIRFSQSWNERFHDIAWYDGVTRAPLLFDVAAVLECKVVRTVRIGDHMIVVGEVVHAKSSERTPLAYLERNYGTVVNSRSGCRPEPIISKTDSGAGLES